MPHIILLDDWMALLEQMHDYSETIQSHIDKGAYAGEQLADAQSLLGSVVSFIGQVNTSYRGELDSKIADLEGFLGI